VLVSADVWHCLLPVSCAMLVYFAIMYSHTCSCVCVCERESVCVRLVSSWLHARAKWRVLMSYFDVLVCVRVCVCACVHVIVQFWAFCTHVQNDGCWRPTLMFVCVFACSCNCVCVRAVSSWLRARAKWRVLRPILMLGPRLLVI